MTTTHSGSLERLLLLLFFLLLLFLLLLLLLLGSRAPDGGGELGALALLGHQAAVVLVAGVVPAGLSRGEVEVVDVSGHILAAGGEERGERKEWGGGYFGTSKRKTQEREGEMAVALSPETLHEFIQPYLRDLIGHEEITLITHLSS